MIYYFTYKNMYKTIRDYIIKQHGRFTCILLFIISILEYGFAIAAASSVSRIILLVTCIKATNVPTMQTKAIPSSKIIFNNFPVKTVKTAKTNIAGLARNCRKLFYNRQGRTKISNCYHNCRQGRTFPANGDYHNSFVRKLSFAR